MSHYDTRSAAVFFDRSRLTLARKLAGKKKVDVARELGVTPAAVSQYESGVTKPSQVVVAKLALLLGVPPSFFMTDRRPLSGVDATPAFFRSLRSSRVSELDSAEAYAHLVWEVAAILERRAKLPEVSIPSLPASASASTREIEELAGTA